MTDQSTGQNLSPPVPAVPLPALQTDRSPEAPPHPLDGKWYLHISEQTYGPYTGHQIKDYITEGRVDRNTQILRVGSESWVAAGDDARFAGLLRERASPVPPVSAAAGATVIQVTNQITQPDLNLALEIAGTKSPGVALLLSFFFCGVGQMYNGQVAKGFLMLIGCVLLWLVFLGWTIWIWSMVDAYSTAKRINVAYLRRSSLSGAA